MPFQNGGSGANDATTDAASRVQTVVGRFATADSRIQRNNQKAFNRIAFNGENGIHVHLSCWNCVFIHHCGSHLALFILESMDDKRDRKTSRHNLPFLEEIFYSNRSSNATRDNHTASVVCHKVGPRLFSHSRRLIPANFPQNPPIGENQCKSRSNSPSSEN